MKRFLLLILLLTAAQSFTQILNPVKWEVSVEPISDLEYELVFTADIEKNWAIYAQYVEEGGPLPTVISLEPSINFTALGPPIEKNLNKVTKHDSIFEMTVSKFYNRAIFEQRIKIIRDATFELKGNIEYMTCDDSRCTYMPDNPFKLNYSSQNGLVVAKNSMQKAKSAAESSNILLYGIQPNQIQSLK